MVAYEQKKNVDVFAENEQIHLAIVSQQQNGVYLQTSGIQSIVELEYDQMVDVVSSRWPGDIMDLPQTRGSYG